VLVSVVVLSKTSPYKVNRTNIHNYPLRWCGREHSSKPTSYRQRMHYYQYRTERHCLSRGCCRDNGRNLGITGESAILESLCNDDPSSARQRPTSDACHLLNETRKETRREKDTRKKKFETEIETKLERERLEREKLERKRKRREKKKKKKEKRKKGQRWGIRQRGRTNTQSRSQGYRSTPTSSVIEERVNS
jgi:hypothetical protein